MNLRQAKVRRIDELKQDIATVKIHIQYSDGARKDALKKLLTILKSSVFRLEKH